jgi:hypothetical protein
VVALIKTIKKSNELHFQRGIFNTNSIPFLDIAKSVQSDLIQDNEAVGTSE